MGAKPNLNKQVCAEVRRIVENFAIEEDGSIPAYAQDTMIVKLQNLIKYIYPNNIIKRKK